MQKQVIKKKTASDNHIQKENLITVLINALFQLIMFTAISLICFIADVDGDVLLVFALTAFCIGSFIGAFYTGRKKRKNGLIIGLIFTLPANLIVLFSSLLINKFHFDYYVIITLLALTLSAAAGGVISVNVRKKTKIKR